MAKHLESANTVRPWNLHLRGTNAIGVAVTKLVATGRRRAHSRSDGHHHPQNRMHVWYGLGVSIVREQMRMV